MIYIIYPDVELWNYVLDKEIDGLEKRPLNRYTSKLQQLFRQLNVGYTLSPKLILAKSLIKDLSHLAAKDILIVADYMDISLLYAIDTVVNKEVKKYLWLWNPLKGALKDRFMNIREFISNKFIVSTFDPQDASEYNLELRSQFFRMDQDSVKNDIVDRDFCFVGFNKGRETKIEDIRNELKDYRCDFTIVHNMSEYICYKDYLEIVSRSKCLVDVVQDGQSGLTLRPFEAMALGKKLLTNNHCIKAYDFYNPDNVFLIGERSWGEINKFINTPYNRDPNFLLKYDVSTWLQSFRA